MTKKTRSHTKEVEAIVERIRSVDEITPFVKMAAYARNKQGKTRFASTAPNVLIIDIDEEGTRSAVGSGADVVEVNSFDEVVHVYWFLKAGKHKYETVALDTTTALHKAAIRKVLGEAEDRDPTREPNTPDKRTWGRANNLVNNLLLDFRNLEMHVIFLAQERVVEDDEEEEPALHTVDLSPGTRGVLLGCVGIIGRIYLRETTVKRKGKRVQKWEARMLVGPHESYDTGDRTNALPRIVRNPNFEDIIDVWQENPPEED